jgi:Flp pilus assembly protein TadD
LNNVTQSQLLAKQNRLDQALAEAQLAVALAPDSIQTQSGLGYLLLKLQRPDEAREHLQKALALAETVHPEFRDEWTIPGLKGALGQ